MKKTIVLLFTLLIVASAAAFQATMTEKPQKFITCYYDLGKYKEICCGAHYKTGKRECVVPDYDKNRLKMEKVNEN